MHERERRRPMSATATLIADAVAEWLAFATLKTSPVPALAPDEADELAVGEVRAHRVSRDSAA